MSAGKRYTSDSSSEESDQPEKQSDDNTGVGRSYECSFCKRGFTNAQALGGHMNIHRKDKAKSKGKNQNLESPKSHQEFTSQKYFSSISSEQRLYSSPKGKYMITHQLYFPSPNAGYLHACQPFDLGKDHHGTLHEYRLMDQNLSLRIGPSCMEDIGGERKNNMMETDIDLELRLGHP